MDRVTKPQKKMLITLLRETKFMEGKKEKEWYWEKIQAALNTIGPKKTIIQWKKCWRDMRLTTRKKLAELKRCQLAGSSPPPGIELNQEDNDIIDIVGTEYFYEEMNGELKPENFMSNFDYVPEHFCDAILTASAAAGAQQHMQHQKDHQHNIQQQPQDHQTTDGETNDAPVSSNNTEAHGSSFQTTSLTHLQTHNGDHPASIATTQQHNSIPQHPAFHTGLPPHLLRRQQHATAALQRENMFEEKLLQFMQDAFPKRSKKRKSRDPDKLFLLSLYDEIKRIPEEIRLDVKGELIQVLKKYQKKAPVKQEKSQSTVSTSSSKQQNASSVNEKIQLPQQATLSHSMYQLQKKYDKNEKESSPQSQVDRVQQHVHETATSAQPGSLHASQQMSHALFQMQKKYEDTGEKVHPQNEQRKHVDTVGHQQQHSAHQQPPPSSNDHHLHHPQMPHGIMFPLSQIRNESSATQHLPHNSHQPQQPQQQHPHQQQAQQHHPPTIFGSSTASASMTADRPGMAYENVG